MPKKELPEQLSIPQIKLQLQELYAELGGTSAQNLDFIIGNVKGEWNIINGLKFTTQFGVRLNFTYQKNFSNSYTNIDTIQWFGNILSSDRTNI